MRKYTSKSFQMSNLLCDTKGLNIDFVLKRYLEQQLQNKYDIHLIQSCLESPNASGQTCTPCLY